MVVDLLRLSKDEFREPVYTGSPSKRREPLVYLGYWFTLLVIASQFTLHVPFILFPSHHEGGVTT